MPTPKGTSSILKSADTTMLVEFKFLSGFYIPAPNGTEKEEANKDKSENNFFSNSEYLQSISH